MKKQIENLLASENCTLAINKFATLHRWTKDSLNGQDCDCLSCSISILSSCDCIRDISSRDWKGIIAEVEEIIHESFKNAAETLCRNLENGYIG